MNANEKLELLETEIKSIHQDRNFLEWRKAYLGSIVAHCENGLNQDMKHSKRWEFENQLETSQSQLHDVNDDLSKLNLKVEGLELLFSTLAPEVMTEDEIIEAFADIGIRPATTEKLPAVGDLISEEIVVTDQKETASQPDLWAIADSVTGEPINYGYSVCKTAASVYQTKDDAEKEVKRYVEESGESVVAVRYSDLKSV